MRFGICGALAGVLVALASPAVAQEAPPLGDTAWAMPGIARVGVVGASTAPLSLALTGGYGFIESIDEQDGANHRVMGSLGLAVAPLSWLQIAAKVDGRFDKHPADAEGSDESIVGDPRLSLRLGQVVSDHWHLGGDITWWVPGQDAPSFEVAASAVDFRGLLAWRSSSGTTVGTALGFRLDNSSESAPDGALRLGDRISLGVSDSNAVLLGLGLSQPVGSSLEVLGEVSADVLVGSDAPSVGESPIRVTAGARYHLSSLAALEGLVDFSPSSRPDLAIGAARVPIEPRFAVSVGLRFRFGVEEEAPPEVEEPPPPPEVEPEPPKPEPPKAPPTGEARGKVVDEGGRPIPDVLVRVTVGEKTVETRTFADGTFVAEGLPFGTGTVEVETPGFEPETGTVEVGENSKPLEVLLHPAVPRGQLRGLIRSFGGNPLEATISVKPGDKEFQVGSDGRFEVDVPPGKYTVTIRAEGYVSQSRRVRVENRGVTVINAELQKKR